jgi:hypothetical protein
MKQRSRAFLPYSIGEPAIRRALQNLYVAIIGSNDNARSLIERGPFDLDVDTAKGNHLVKKCFIAVSHWLARNKEFAVSERVFKEQIVEPARCAARFKLNITHLPIRSTKLEGIIFSKSSPYYSKYHQRYLVTLSVIIPELETVMNLRCYADGQSNLEYGKYEIKGVQPIPYVNRLHPVNLSDLSLEKKDDTVNLSDLDFLKISFQDTGFFSYSLAMENFSEVESDQISVRRRHLGAVCILAGRLISVSPPRVTLQKNDKKYDEIKINQNFLLSFFYAY